MKMARYGQAAMIAAILAVTANGVWAQTPIPGITFRIAVQCCKDGKSCKGGECCIQCCKGKDGECCIECSKCETKSTCCKDDQCPSCTSSAVSTKSGSACCPILSQLAKGTAIIMVMPSSMPLPVLDYMQASGILPHPPIPAGPQVFLPPLMPPMAPIPPTPSMGFGAAMMPTVCTPTGVCPCPDGNTVWAAGTAPVVPCSTIAPATTAKMCITAKPSSDKLEMCVGDETCIRCKKMAIQVGDKEITLSRFDDRVRVRGEDLKATANRVRKDGKDHLILEGNVVLHFKKDGRTANLIADRVELDPSNGDMAIQKTAHYDSGE